MKKVLLTGATGLIGKYAIEPLIKAGFEIFAVSSKVINDKSENLHWIKANLLDSKDIIKIFNQYKPEYLLHFAWDTTPGNYLESNLNKAWMNSSLKMLEQFKLNAGKRAVFAGTCFEYEFKDEPLKENGALNPETKYAKCKAKLNKLATKFCQESEISFGWGRIFYVFGEGEHEKRLVPVLINNLKQDKDVSVFSGELVKDYMFAGDIAEAFVKFLDTNVLGCVNICTGNPIKLKEIASIIAQKLGKEHLVKIDNKPSKEPAVILGDNTRLTTEVGFIPRYSFENAIDKIIK